MALDRYNDDWSRHARREGRDWADSQRKPPATKQTGQIANLILMIVLWIAAKPAVIARLAGLTGIVRR